MLELLEIEPEEMEGGKCGCFGFLALLLVLVVALVAGGIGGGVGYWLVYCTNGLLHRFDVKLVKVGKFVNWVFGSVVDIAKRVGLFVVLIVVIIFDEYVVGFGVVIDKNGYVLTN